MKRCAASLGFFLVVAMSEAMAEAVPVVDQTGIVKHGQVPAAGATEDSVFLVVPHFRQELNLCVPTSAAMVLALYGNPHAPRELKVLSRGKTYDANAPFDDFTITWWRDLLSGMKPLGYTWHERGFPNTADGFRIGSEAIKASVRSGDPVLVDVALYDSHTFVIVGYDDSQGLFYINDPNIAKPGIRQLTFAQLEAIWNGLSYGADARPALFTSRIRSDPTTRSRSK